MQTTSRWVKFSSMERDCTRFLGERTYLPPKKSPRCNTLSNVNFDTEFRAKRVRRFVDKSDNPPPRVAQRSTGSSVCETLQSPALWASPFGALRTVRFLLRTDQRASSHPATPGIVPEMETNRTTEITRLIPTATEKRSSVFLSSRGKTSSTLISPMLNRANVNENSMVNGIILFVRAIRWEICDENERSLRN